MDKQKQFEEIGNMAKPLQEWLKENFNPNCKIEIDYSGVRILSGEIYNTLGAEGLGYTKR